MTKANESLAEKWRAYWALCALATGASVAAACSGNDTSGGVDRSHDSVRSSPGNASAPRSRPFRPQDREEMLSRVPTSPTLIGQEVSVPTHLPNGREFQISLRELIDHGREVFLARWTQQEGQGRPFGKGNDGELTDPLSPLSFPHSFNRFSGPAAGSCAGCHNQPRAGGGGDIAGSVFVLGNRFDYVTFDPNDTISLRGRLDERGVPATLQSVSSPRKTTGMFGSGYIEVLARQMTEELRAQAAACGLGQTCALSSKSVDFGSLTHLADGTWDTTDVVGLPPTSVSTTGSASPSLVIQPFFQAGAVVSLRHFSVNAFNRLHGMQAEERFGTDQDPDGDGFVNELTIADVTAVSVFQATLPVPGQVIPRQKAVERAILRGEDLFESIGCASCHLSSLPLDVSGGEFTEPNPYNPSTSLRLEDVEQVYSIDLSDESLPTPRLQVADGVVDVPAYTDLKLHDITTGLPSCASNPQLEPLEECDPDVEPLSQHYSASQPEFFEGNALFLTRRLWGIANQHAFGHHGQYTTMLEAVLAHHGEAEDVRRAFEDLDSYEQGAVIEFLKSLQVLPVGTECTTIDEDGRCRSKGR